MAFSDEFFLLEVDALLVYREVFYKEKSNQKWFFQGSHNMTFFHQTWEGAEKGNGRESKNQP